jgi:hypothetical protein
MGTCKADSFSMWKMDGCKGCHMSMDPLGFGLENYDRTGKARSIAPTDVGKTTCQITGQGELNGVAFKGVAGLADKLVESGAIDACATTQLAHLLLGRELQDEEERLFGEVGGRFRMGGYKFDQLLLELVTLPGFGYRIAE